MSLKYRDANGVEQGIAGTPYDVMQDLQEDLANEIATRNILNAHNILPATYEYMNLKNTAGTWAWASGGDPLVYTFTSTVGVVFTCYFEGGNNVYHALKKVIVNGTATGGSIEFNLANYDNDPKFLANGKYIATGNFTLNKIVNGSYSGAFPANFEITDSIKAGRAYIYCQVGTSYDNVEVSPMIRLASDKNEAFSPYVMTNKQLQESMQETLCSSALGNGSNYDANDLPHWWCSFWGTLTNGPNTSFSQAQIFTFPYNMRLNLAKFNDNTFNFGCQIVIGSGSNGMMFVRSKYNNTWTGWIRCDNT